MVKVIAYIIIVLAIINSMYSSLPIDIGHAHFDIYSVCEAGYDLVTESTLKENVDNFRSICRDSVIRFNQMYTYALYSRPFDLIFSGVLIILSLFLLGRKTNHNKLEG